MNRAYKTVYNELTGTFVAVAENVKARGKRSSNRVNRIKAISTTAIAAGAFLMGNATAQVVVEDGPGGNSIEFTQPGGSIDFGSDGTISGVHSITGLSSLSVSGSINANQLILGGTPFSAADIATTTQLNSIDQTLDDVQQVANQANTAAENARSGLANLNGRLDALGDAVETKRLVVGDDILVASETGVIVGSALDMGGNKITHLADGTISASSQEAVTGGQIHHLLLAEGAQGIRYFHANSSEPDSAAAGVNAVAIGPNAVAEGEGSFAAGNGASTTETATDAIALGTDAITGNSEDGEGAIAIGRNSIASRNGSLAVGDGAGSTSFNTSAFGAQATADAPGATALGYGAQAFGTHSVAIGEADAIATESIALGAGAYSNSARSIALGAGAGMGTISGDAGDRTDHIAIGTQAGRNVAGNLTTAIGYQAGSNVKGDDNVALGTEAGRGLEGNNNISIGKNANDMAGIRAQAIAIGDNTRAGSDSVAMGSGAWADGSETLALGKGARANANGVAVGAHAVAEGSNIALGRNSAARDEDLIGTGYLTGTAAPGSVVSVGNSNPGESFQRRITNVADGAQRYDAVNVGQLQGAQQSVANLIGGNVVVQDNGSFGGYVVELEDTNGVKHQYSTVADAINAVSSGAISVLPGNAVIYNPNGTLKVADGVLSDDAVSLGQLEQAIAESGSKYFSANSTVDANRGNDGATGENAMAIGPAAVAGGSSAVALGHAARVNEEAHRGVAIGHEVSARAVEATVVGSFSHAYDQAGVAIGNRAVSRGENSVVIGTGAEADPQTGATVDNAIVIGTIAESTADDAIAIGHSALANGERSVAQGFEAHALANDAQAMGTRSRAVGVASQASGLNALAGGRRSIATGDSAQAYAENGIAIGSGAVVGLRNPPIGEDARNQNGIAIGNQALADYQNAMALGVTAQARAHSATAIGQGALARHENSVALGSFSETDAVVRTPDETIDGINYSYAGAGDGVTSTVSVGKAGAERTITNVAAGRISATSTDAINGSQLYGTNRAVESLADNLDTAGQSVADALGGTSVYDETTHTVTAGLSVNNNNYTNVQDALQYVGQGWDVSANGAPGANVAPGAKVDFANTDGNISIARDATNLTFDLSDNIKVSNSIAVNNGPVINAGGINMRGQKISNLAAGSADTDAVNVGQLKEVQEVANAGWNVGVNGETSSGKVAPGGNVDFSNPDDNITIMRDGTDLTFALSDDLNVGNSITVGGTVINGDAVSTNNVTSHNVTTTNLTSTGVTRLGENITIDQSGATYNGPIQNETHIANKGYVDEEVDKLAQTPLQFAGDMGDNVSRKLGETVKLTGGATDASSLTEGNIGVVADGNDTLAIRLNKDIDLGSDGSISIGDTVMNTSGLTVKDSIANPTANTTVEAGMITVWANPTGGSANTIIIDANAGTIAGLRNITTDYAEFADGSGRAATEDQLKQVNDTANMGWYVSASGEGVASDNKVAPGSVVDFSNADGNIAIERNGTDLSFNLKKDIDLSADGSVTVGNTVVNNDGLTVDDGAGNVVTTGATGTTLKNATGDMAALSADGATFTNAVGDSTNIGAGIVSVADASGTTNISGSQIVVGAGGANPVTINGNTGTINGLTNTTWDPSGPIVSGQAATEDQLRVVSDTANAGWNLSDADGNTVNIGPDGKATFNGDSNITVAQTGADQDGVIEISLNETIDLGTDGSLTTGNTVINNNGVAVGSDVQLGSTGLVINNGPSVTTGGINAGGFVVSNVAPGVLDSDAVNMGQLRPISEFVNLDASGKFSYNGNTYDTLQQALDSMHWNVEAPTAGSGNDGSGGTGSGGGAGGSGDGTGGGTGGSTPIHNTNTVGFNGDGNILVSKTDRAGGEGADINIALAKDIAVDSITAVQVNAGKVNADRIEINNGGPIIDNNGINMNNQRITNVAAGVDAGDAVNVGQLQQATGHLQGQVNTLRNDLHRQDKKLSAGVAAAMATASLPQAYLPGKSMMAIAGGTWNSESGMAIGFSGISDNGKWVYKLSGNATSRGDYGGGVGIGYQW